MLGHCTQPSSSQSCPAEGCDRLVERLPRRAARRDRCETMAVAAPIPVDFSAVECTEFFKLNESITFFVLLTSFILAVEYLVPPVRLGPNSGQ